MNEIATTGEIGVPTVFIRFNPDRWKDEDGKIRQIGFEERLDILKKEIEEWLDPESVIGAEHFCKVIYLFYDGPQRQEDFVPVSYDE